MTTENNQHDKPSFAAKMKEGVGESASRKTTKRQATQAELDHPLHGVKLDTLLESLVDFYGWEYLAREVNILCFKRNPTIKVSLKFLRKFDWAREHCEDIYIDMLQEGAYKKHIENKKEDNKP